MRSAGSPAARQAWSLSWSILPDRRPSLGRGVPLAGIGDLSTEVNSGGSGKRSETEDWLEFHADGEVAGVEPGPGAVQRSKGGVFPLGRTKTPGVISQSTPSPVTKPPLKALVLPVFVVGSK